MNNGHTLGSFIRRSNDGYEGGFSLERGRRAPQPATEIDNDDQMFGLDEAKGYGQDYRNPMQPAQFLLDQFGSTLRRDE